MSAAPIRRMFAPALFLVLAAALGTGCEVRSGASASPVPTVATGSPTPVRSVAAAVATAPPAATPAPATPLSQDFTAAVREVAQRVKPAVVQITSEQVALDQFNQPFTVPAGVGSGVIYDNQGHILTNNHVIQGAQQLQVSLPDGRSFTGKLIGADPQTDLAVVQISGDNLPVAQLGDSGRLQVGDWVVAIGNALALPGGPTVTVGVVSALGRSVQEPGGPSGAAGPYLFDLVQTDAPINPGNSGGALVNLAGQVIGINTLVAGQAEPGVQAQGIGFAIGISTAKPIADQLQSTGRAIHPFVGIRYQQLSPGIAARLGTNTRQGIYIVQVVSGSPAAAAGLQARDIVTQVDGAPLKDESSFAEAVNQHKPGDTITLSVLRNGQQSQVQVKLGEMPPG